jgi:hypothetical protein
MLSGSTPSPACHHGSRQTLATVTGQVVHAVKMMHVVSVTLRVMETIIKTINPELYSNMSTNLNTEV